METNLFFSLLKRIALGLIILMLMADRPVLSQIADDCMGTEPNDVCDLSIEGPPGSVDGGSLTAVISSLRKVDPSCPNPTVKIGKQCVLQNDLDLSIVNKTLEIASSTHFNCQGHKIFTSHPGTNAQNRSQPEVGILLREAYGVKIQNCVIQGFDFGIFALNSKNSANAGTKPGTLQQLGNDILDNSIDGRSAAIELVEVDNTRIKENHITLQKGISSGVFILRNSDFNEVKNNVIELDQNSSPTQVGRVPGPTMVSNPVVQGAGHGVSITQGTGLPNLVNALIDKKLYQFPNPIPPVADTKNFSEDNLVEGNLIITNSDKNGVAITNTLRPTIRSNLITNVRFGVAFGGLNLSGVFPGSCSGDSTRFCLANSDCNIDINGNGAVDVDESKGACMGAQTLNVDTISDGGTIENNEITGPFLGGIQIATPNILVQGNDITGPVWASTDFSNAGNGGGAGIEIRMRALSTANITRNSISTVPAALRIVNPQPFAAKITLNDFTDYDKEVLTPPGYAIATELSVDPEGNVCGPNSTDCQGNYWGLTCDTANGFDPAKVISLATGVVQTGGTVNITGPVNPSVHDSHPYGVPVRDLSEEILPKTLAQGYCSEL